MLEKLWFNELPEKVKTSFSNNIEFKKTIFDLSIIVPVYNTEAYLEKCLESIIKQKTDFKYEVILVNDGSIDCSEDICKKYCDKYENFIYIRQENKGASAARNNGIKNSRGKYICFIDSDDYISLNFVEIMMNEIISKSADFVKCGYYEFDSATNKIIKKVLLKNKTYNGNNSYKRDLKGHACMCIIDKKILKNVKFPEGYWFEDIIIKFLLFPQCTKILTVKAPLYYYRVNINSTSNNKSSKKNYKCLSQFYLIEDCVNCYEKLSLDYNKCFFENFYNESFAMLWLRTKNLEKEVVKIIFDGFCDYYTAKIIKTRKNNNYLIRNYILKNRKIKLWKIFSVINYIVIR